MQLQNYIRRNDFGLELRMFAFVPRVLMPSHIPPGPAVETAFLNMRNVIGNEVVAQGVALVHGTPQFTGLRVYRKPSSRIPNPKGIHAHTGAVRIEF